RLRALVAALTAAVLVAAGLTTVAVSRARESERLRGEGLVGSLTSASLANLRNDPDLSALLALHAVQASVERGETVPSGTVEALHWSIQAAGVTYPVDEGPTAVIAGPLGTRGVFDLPLAQLANATRSKIPRDLNPEECRRCLGSEGCSLPAKFPADIPAERIKSVQPPPGVLLEP